MKVVDSPSISSRIELAFQSASTTTGTDFGYLVKTASRESNFDAAAKARTSSATGLFQFIESTWLETVKTTGADHGLGDYAADITRRADGRYTVSDPARRREILDLRKDPEISAMMAGELTRKNSDHLERRLGRAPSAGELYAAHFLGAGGATKLITLAEKNPDMPADQVFTRQARANRSIFYERSGAARSVSEVLAGLTQQHDGAGAVEYATIAAATPAATPVAKARAIAALAGLGARPGGIAVAADGPALAATQAARDNDIQRVAATLSEATAAAAPPAAAPVETPPVAVAAADTADSQDAPLAGKASARITSAWSAAMPSTPFQALFRNDQASQRERFDSTFMNAFSAQPEALRVAVAAHADETAAPEPPKAPTRGPFDLTGFLKYQIFKEPEDLLPPV